MLNIMQLEQCKELYSNYLKIKPNHKTVDFTCKVGDKNVTIRTGQGDYRKITTGN